MRARCAVLAATMVFAVAASARADDAADAEKLFREARTLMHDNKLEEACEKFDASRKLDPAAGTLLNLAECWERRGMTASALSMYREAQRASIARGRKEWGEFAGQKIATLAKQVPSLVVRIASAAPAGLEVRRDDEIVGADAFDKPVPVDPGTHFVTAKAPGKRPWSTKVAVSNGATLTIDVPALDPEDGAPPAKPAVVTAPPAGEHAGEEEGGSSQRTLAFVAGGVGLAAIAFGGISAILANDALGEAKAHCPSYPDQCAEDGSGTRANHRAQTWATLSTVGFVAGGVLGAAGIVLYVTAPKGKRPTSAAGIGPTGAWISGVF